VRSEEEIRAEIARLETLAPTLPRQYQRVAAGQKIDALRWVLGESDQS
jgi:hypothetical protein